MGHYDECRVGYCPGCGAGPGNFKNGKCEFCDKTKPTKESLPALNNQKTLTEQIEAAESHLKELRDKQKNEWPKPYTLYLHSNKDDFYDALKKFGFDKKAATRFIHTAYEVEFTGTVDKDGNFYCESVNGTKLITPVLL